MASTYGEIDTGLSHNELIKGNGQHKSLTNITCKAINNYQHYQHKTIVITSVHIGSVGRQQ